MLSLRIALRYFFSAKSHGAVNVISAISVAGVAVATAAIVIVLSVFNGFSTLIHSRFSSIDPDLMIVPESGKVFARADSLARIATDVEGVTAASPTLSERGLIIAGDNSQLGVVFKGIDDDHTRVNDIDEITVYKVNIPETDTLPKASLAIGVASRLDLNALVPVDLYTLRRIGRINPANPAGAFFSQQFLPERILSVEQPEFDADHILIPIDYARELLQYYDNEASAIEIRVSAGKSPSEVAKSLKKVFSPSVYRILTREQQHAESYRMVAVEKWVTFAMLIFILIIAAFNIISTLSLMVIEKRGNMSTLRFIGAPRKTVRSIFAMMGALITCAGGIIGIILGVCLSLAQQWGGFIKLSGDEANLTITEYPVRVEAVDITAVLVIVIAVAALAALSTRIFTRKIQ